MSKHDFISVHFYTHRLSRWPFEAGYVLYVNGACPLVAVARKVLTSREQPSCFSRNIIEEKTSILIARMQATSLQENHDKS